MRDPRLRRRLAVVAPSRPRRVLHRLPGGVRADALLAERARTAPLLKRLPTLQEVADTAAFVASDRGGAITGSIINLTCGSLVD